MLKLESSILLLEYGTNTWLLFDDESREAILVDPAAPSQAFLDRINKDSLKVKYIVNTHGHGDHIGGNPLFHNALHAPIAIHRLDAGMLVNNKKNLSEFMGTPLKGKSADILLDDGDILKLGCFEVKVMHTPGHTPGSICLLCGKYLISGDTLFELSIGRTDFPGGSHTMIINSIKSRLFTLPEDTIVFPGHGPATSIGLEKANNPFVR
ncbi:MAG: MBL fold metallo-hydrolase [Candidatus Cloacimonadaceae bacterium]|nr:MBL fold metallo-hydrolase [Candidatus Cloacimonadaceae bacterium]MDP3115113.1 MBL fold metallo-hydrolase [Candidatus Cloacimonadaceae bacterium]